MAGAKHVRGSSCPQVVPSGSQNDNGHIPHSSGLHRSRRWRTRRFSDLLEGRIPETFNIKRWDGAARAFAPWNNLGRDPELWDRNGNCFVHLYGRGHSRRGPAFKVPLEALLIAKCHPLVARFMARDLPELATAHIGQEYLDYLNQANPDNRIDLYISSPPMTNKEDGLRHQLAVRNFFAWVFRRSVVGEHLGTALIGLMNSMAEFRCAGENNMDDLISYMDEEGYLDMRNQPAHALAILNFAEYFQARDLYIDAFVHCVGMSDRLFAVPEYQVITSTSRKHIRQAKAEMDQKLGQASVMLRNFMEDDFSEANIGLTASGRAHLERFRTFLLAFFTGRLGYYPPRPVDLGSPIFEPEVYRIMREDFEALYEYLVDKSYTTSATMPSSAQGGICTVQAVHSFDLRHSYPSLPHPLPLLPETVAAAGPRRMSWLQSSKSDKLQPDQRLLSHAALAKATNKTGMRNQLVIAYRKFEEDSIFFHRKTDRKEKLSHVDARKIRWILIYSVYQVVRSCTESPKECQDVAEVHYHVALCPTNLLPWKESQRSSLAVSNQGRSKHDWTVSTLVPSMPAPAPSTWPWAQGFLHSGLDIKPDVDHFLGKSGRRDSWNTMSTSTTTSLSSRPTIPPRVRSLNTSLRRSLQIFVPSSHHDNEPIPLVRNRLSKRLSYHEIVIQGYGNGTNEVLHDNDDSSVPYLLSNKTNRGSAIFEDRERERELEREREHEPGHEHDADLMPQPLAVRSPSTSSTSSSNSKPDSTASHESHASSVSSAPSTCSFYSAAAWPEQDDDACNQSTANEFVAPSATQDGAIPRKRASIETMSSSVYSVLAEYEDISPLPPAVPRRNSRRKLSGLHPYPLRIRKNPSLMVEHLALSGDAESPYWFNEGRASGEGGTFVDEKSHGGGYDNRRSVYSDASLFGEGDDIWAQFADVGGLTEVHSVPRDG